MPTSSRGKVRTSLCLGCRTIRLRTWRKRSAPKAAKRLRSAPTFRHGSRGCLAHCRSAHCGFAPPPAGTAAAARVPVSAGLWGPGETAHGGGQSATFVPVLLLRGSLSTGARSAIPCFGLCVSGLSGKRDAAVGGAMRRRLEILAGEGNKTGDITHLEAPPQYFAFCSLSQYLFSLFVRIGLWPQIPTGRPYLPELPPPSAESILP